MVVKRGMVRRERKKNEVASRDVSPTFVYRLGTSAPIFKDGLSSFVSCFAFIFIFIFIDVPASNLLFVKRVAQALSFFLTTCPKI